MLWQRRAFNGAETPKHGVYNLSLNGLQVSPGGMQAARTRPELILIYYHFLLEKKEEQRKLTILKKQEEKQMARPIKEGLSYFPMDVGFFEDSKIKILRARYGPDGVMVYLYYICRIYCDKGYYLKIDDDFDYTSSLDLGMNVQKIVQIRKFLLERKLLDSILFRSDTILTARSIQSRFQSAKKFGKRPVWVEERYWLLEETETEPFINLRNTDSNSINKDDKPHQNLSKPKKNALKESKTNHMDDDEHVTKSISGFSPETEELFEFFEEIYYKLNDVQKTWINGYILTYGLDNVYEALEETGRRNVKDPISYMQKVLRTLELEQMEE